MSAGDAPFAGVVGLLSVARQGGEVGHRALDVLQQHLGHKRLILNDSQKRRLARAAVRVPRDVLRDVGTLFSPDTLVKWHRWLVARKYDGSAQRPSGARTRPSGT